MNKTAKSHCMLTIALMVQIVYVYFILPYHTKNVKKKLWEFPVKLGAKRPESIIRLNSLFSTSYHC